MKRKVLVLVFVIAFFGFGLINPTANFESISMQLQDQPDQLEFTPSAIGDNTEDYVDQISNLHAPADKGTHGVFADLQAYDTTMDTLTEANQGGVPIDETDYVDGAAATLVDATHTGTSPYLDAQDGTSFVTITKGGGYARWYTFGDTAETGTGFTITLYIYISGGDGNDDLNWYIDTTGDDTAESAIRAMKIGAADYLTKPFNVDEVIMVIKGVLEKGKLQDEVRYDSQPYYWLV